MTVNHIIKKAIERLKNEGRLLTPDFYAEAFCKEAKKAGILTEDCNQVDKYVSSLDAKFQNEVKQYRVKTTQELVRFLISKINRMNPTQATELLDAYQGMSKAVLQVIQVLHNSEATQLAQKNLDLLKTPASPEQFEHFKAAWINFLTLYDDTFLQKLAPLGSVDVHDLKKSVEGLSLNRPSATPKSDLKRASSLLVASLVPSIASSVNDEIAEVSTNLRDNASLLTSDTMASDVKEAIKLRIALDKAALKEMVLSLDGVLDKLSLQLIELIERSDSSTIEIESIKRDLEMIDLEKTSDFKTAHTKLYNIATTLEEKTKELSIGLKEHKTTVQGLSIKIENLEKELILAKQASREDFLTKLYNKRALDEMLSVKEGEYERYGREYSLVMFDLDLFKDVNDTHGHEAGDAVLAGFGKILKKSCREVDIVGRYGGEEFLAILGNTDKEGAIRFAHKVNEQVKKTRFMYRGDRIAVTVSGGVAMRGEFPALKATLNSADEHLYEAKRNGRNRIEPRS